MSYLLSLLSVSQAENVLATTGTSVAEKREAHSSEVWPDTAVGRPDEFALPSGVCSMEHWLDLNA